MPWGQDSVWQAVIEVINTGDVVALDPLYAHVRGIRKAVSGETKIIGISQISIATGTVGQIRLFGEGIVNVGSNIVSAGDLLMPSTTPGIAITATEAKVGQVCGMALEGGTGIIKCLVFHL